MGSRNVLSDLDARLVRQGDHLRLWDALRAHLRELEGVWGTTFAVWAPNAQRVSVVGDFNDWDGRVHGMRLRAECGVWEIFVPLELTGTTISTSWWDLTATYYPCGQTRSGFAHELRPATASVVMPPSAHLWSDAKWLARRGETSGRDRPIAIYECTSAHGSARARRVDC